MKFAHDRANENNWRREGMRAGAHGASVRSVRDQEPKDAGWPCKKTVIHLLLRLVQGFVRITRDDVLRGPKTRPIDETTSPSGETRDDERPTHEHLIN